MLNLPINATYYPLFKDENALKFLGNEILKDYGKEAVIEHDDIEEWKMNLLADLAKVLMSEEDGRIFLSQLSRAYTEQQVLKESGVKKSLVYLLFCDQQDDDNDCND
ncbi:hypothetical protein [Vibrio phage VP4B]|uniref:Uncharacterized protein n=1 Tax=Vibrio phage VP4B TaxID=1262540 RepID=V9LZV1_9CAUD|nr:hypothetical protein FDJ61_gp096 [Vibrio phage VP4B]AGB07210.1 hypothetical protein [Vibrio phage VP4B]